MNEPIQEKTPKPPGLVPKNVQSWLLIGLALLMVIIMWLTGGKKPQSAVKTANAGLPAQAPLEINETQITELQNRIQELQRQQLVAQSALAQQTRLLGGIPQDSQPGEQSSAAANQPQERAEDTIQSERKRREYLSLFASNVALSYRKSASSTPTPTEPSSNPAVTNSLPEGPDPAEPEQQLLKEMSLAHPQPGLPPPAPSNSSPAQNGSSETNNDRKEEGSRPAAAPSGTHNAAAGKTYVLF